MDFVYIKDEQYYIDRYDLSTIETCLDYYWGIKNGFEKDRKKFKKFSDEEFAKEVHKVASYTVNAIKGERYRHRAERIREWTDRDKKMQDLFDNARSPYDTLCKECHSPTKVISKDLHNSYEYDAQVMFMFECLKCKKRQVLFEDGREWHYEAPLCPECRTSLKSKSKYSKEVSKTLYSCPNCSYKKEDIYDFKKSRKEQEMREVREKKLLAEYRGEFCLNETNGPDYLRTVDGLKELIDSIKEREIKEASPTFKKAMKLKKLGIVEVEKLLAEILEKEKYVKLVLEKPEIDRFVVVPFTVQDSNTERKETDSAYNLRKVLKKTLEGTNWRLMTEGVTYRLGFLFGKLKGYEREEDLIEIVRKKKEYEAKNTPLMTDEKGSIY